ncbi:NUDIX domain-containing protein [Kangiella geojedonensis]|uniref:8-oxo-dGTP diphosphatase n=1 Tax=Kangiella geojedonensis TaxID=914150 RepID=A0A0F6TRC4_9GAMM|nr:NUDIX domain-containing protein [Kangiella geojedonensis]AKE52630.1 7,8-dihydro-8-oxoguanine-triphosphatase [Kangiella geojedonensis]
MTVVNVAVAVIKVADRVLIAKRSKQQHQGGLWEFPGGKIESGEALADAIQRECFEELDIWPTKIAPLTVIEHEYTDKSVRLEVCLVSDYLGVPVGKEGQPLEWSPVGSLNNYDFPQANKAILKLL